jgi:cell division protein ZapA
MVVSNAPAKKKVDVLLMGQRFSVRSDRDEGYIDSIARTVNQQLDDIRRNTRTVSTHHVALLAALNLADELARTKEALAQVEMHKAELADKAQAALHEVESALAFLPAEWKSREDA